MTGPTKNGSPDDCFLTEVDFMPFKTKLFLPKPDLNSH